jgi:ferritin-like metal-binding protein YciE
LIFAAQKAEHYEIATYGGLATLARTLGYIQVSEILEKTLLEEKQADEMLTYIAENGINYAASQEPED